MAIKNLKTHVKKGISWLASESKYMKDLKEDLEQLEKDLNEVGSKKKDLEDIEKALRDFKYIARSERKSDKLEIRIVNELEELEKDLQREKVEGIDNEHFPDKEQLEWLIQKIKAEARLVLREASRKEGRIIKRLKLIKELIEQGNKSQVKKELSELIEEISNTLKWVEGLIALDEEVERALQEVA